MQRDGNGKNGEIPSLPDFESGPTNYNEPPLESSQDRMPKGDAGRSYEELQAALGRDSRAALRVQVEKLLQRREAPPREAWEPLGQEATGLLVDMLDDSNLREAMRQRVIATLGQLDASSAVPQIGEVLLDPQESALTRTYAANALGAISDPRVITVLGRAVIDEDAMVRRQVAKALARTQRAEAVPYLLALQQDSDPGIASLAAEALEQRPGETPGKPGGEGPKRRPSEE